MNTRVAVFALLLSSVGFSMTANAGIVFRFANMPVEGGKVGGDLSKSDGSVISAPTAELDNVGSYEFSLIAPSRGPYHIYLRYKSLTADDYESSGNFNVQQIVTELDKKTFDVGVFIPHTFLNRYNESIISLRYDDLEHDIASLVADNEVGFNKAHYDQGLWGIHAANKMYFPIREKWQISASFGVNLLMGDRDSDYQGALNGDVSDSEFVVKMGFDTELAVIFTPNERFSITGGYSYSSMFDYLSEDLYAPQSLDAAGLRTQHSGDTHYNEFGPFIELMLGF